MISQNKNLGRIDVCFISHVKDTADKQGNGTRKTMNRINLLKTQARKTALGKNHAMGMYKTDRKTACKAKAVCQICGLAVIVNTDGKPGKSEMTGKALTAECKPKKRSK
jgi:hypothetical protein